MISSGLIIAISTLLLAYWFRYTCLLILCSKTDRNYAPDIAGKHHLAYPNVREILTRAPASLDPLAVALERDYQIVKSLLAHADGFLEPWPMEEWLLRANFAGQRFLYRLSRRLSGRMARAALREMVDVVEHLANSSGARATG
ncbi:MAG: hypothetical protein R2729_15870 [Bryobacteraceae bacterium]